MELWEEKEGGTLVDLWVSDRGAHVIKGKLDAGKNYVLVEKTAPDGYWKAEKVTFTVSLDGRVDQVKMYDRPTEVQVEKRKWREQKGDSKPETGMFEMAERLVHRRAITFPHPPRQTDKLGLHGLGIGAVYSLPGHLFGWKREIEVWEPGKEGKK